MVGDHVRSAQPAICVCPSESAGKFGKHPLWNAVGLIRVARLAAGERGFYQIKESLWCLSAEAFSCRVMFIFG